MIKKKKKKKKNLGGPLVVGARFINTALVAQAVWGPRLPLGTALDTAECYGQTHTFVPSDVCVDISVSFDATGEWFSAFCSQDS